MRLQLATKGMHSLCQPLRSTGKSNLGCTAPGLRCAVGKELGAGLAGPRPSGAPEFSAHFKHIVRDSEHCRPIASATRRVLHSCSESFVASSASVAMAATLFRRLLAQPQAASTLLQQTCGGARPFQLVQAAALSASVSQVSHRSGLKR